MAKLNYSKQADIERGRRGVIFDNSEFLEMTYLNVPYCEKEAAKQLGAKWDAINKQWYCLGKTNKFKQWLKQPNKKPKR